MQGQLRVFVLMFADAACIMLAWLISVVTYWAIGFGNYEPNLYVHYWPIVLVFWAANAVARLYHGNIVYPSLPLGPIEEFRRLVISSLLMHLALMAFLGFSRYAEQISRVVLCSSCLLTLMLAQPLRNIVRSWMKRLGIGQMRVFFVGVGEFAQQLVRECATSCHLGVEIVGVFNEDGKSISGAPCLGGLRDIVDLGKKMDIKRMIACYDERFLRAQLTNLVGQFQYIDFFPTPNAFPMIGSRLVTAGGFGGVEMVNQSRMKALGWEKNFVDILLAIIAFFVCIPLFVIIPLLIKFTSRGPIFYRQLRLGRNGKEMWIWKFRTMYADADERLAEILHRDALLRNEWETKFKLQNDPRVTPIGRFLRMTSLDEIPQLFNVFAGDMAMVGPRPIVDGEIKYYGQRYPLFSSVKPGLTGLWQVSGRSKVDYDRRVSLDCYYVLNWCPWMDLWILIRTVGTVIFMRGAC